MNDTSKQKVFKKEIAINTINQDNYSKSIDKPINLQESRYKNYSSLINNNSNPKLPSILTKINLRSSIISNDTKFKNVKYSTSKNLHQFNNNTDNDICNSNNKLTIIKEQNHLTKFHSRNLDFLKKLSEKSKKNKEEKKQQQEELTKPNNPNPIERLNILKNSFKFNHNYLPFEHRRLELPTDDKNEAKYITDDTFYYYELIHGGNNSEIIEDCLKRRGQWKKYDKSYDDNYYNNQQFKKNIFNSNSKNVITETNYPREKNNLNMLPNLNNENYSLPNLLWSHSSCHIDFNEFSKYRPGHVKKMTNHFENHKEISNKLNLFINMMSYCELHNLDLFSIFPLTFPLRYDSKEYLNSITDFSQIFNNINKFISDNPIDFKYRNLFKLDFKGRVGYKTSLHIPRNLYDGRNLWLVKAIDLNRGRCIKMGDSINGIKNIIQNFYKGMKRNFDNGEKNENMEINKCEYLNDNISNYNKELLLPSISNNHQNLQKSKQEIERTSSENELSPLKKSKKKNDIGIKIDSQINNSTTPTSKQINSIRLINKVKNIQNKTKYINNNENSNYSNLRKYLQEQKTYQNGTVILQKYIEKPLCYKGRKCDMRLWVLLTWDYNVYLFKEGHFKATSIPYDLDSNNLYVHLTNYSVQKYNKDFEKFESGNEISFTDFEISVYNRISVKKDLLPKIKDIILYTMKSVKNKINKMERKICFEIFGYDFMFDVNFQPYLLEINTNPGLEISSPLIAMLIPRLVDDAFKLTIDKVFLLSHNNLERMRKNPFKVGGYDDEENMFELLGNIMYDENLYNKNSE